jgi:hypothetical protein
VIEQLLKRLPDIEIEVKEPKFVFEGGGDYNAITELPVSFKPRSQ